jgi:hypothetical protein
MNPPRIIVRYFEEGTKGRWERLARVLEASIREHCPDWTLDLQVLRADANMYSPLGDQRAVANTRKLDSWCAAVAAAEPEDRLLLLDADTLVRRSLDDVWTLPFDLAYTVKPEGARYPFNGGVVFLRVAARTQTFIRMWRDVNAFFLEHPLEHQVWQPPFGGINQSALGMLFVSSDQAWPDRFKGYRHGLDIQRLPCLEWNCEDEHWDVFDPEVTRIAHFKSELQKLLFTGYADGGNPALVKEWTAMEDASKRTGQWRVTKPAHDRQVLPSEIETPEQGQAIQTPEGGIGIAPPPVLSRKHKRLNKPQKGVVTP